MSIHVKNYRESMVQNLYSDIVPNPKAFLFFILSNIHVICSTAIDRPFIAES